MDAAHGGFPATLGRAISRFQAGLERPVTLEALNDYLLTLRFLLEGGGPASLGMPMRVAALCAEPDDRTEVKATVDNALALEQGALERRADDRLRASPARRDRRRGRGPDARDPGRCRCGHLGTELRTTADEILLGEGLQVGEGAPDTRGETAEWNPSIPIDDEFGIETLEEELEAAVAPPEPEVERVFDHPVGPGREAEQPTGSAPPDHGFIRAQNLSP